MKTSLFILDPILAPPFLRRINRTLLISRPLVWRTGVHWALWYLTLTIIPLVVLGMTFPISRKMLPTSAQIDLIAWFGRICACLTVIGWAAVQLHMPFGERSLRDCLKTVLIYSAIVFAILTLPTLACLAPYIARMALLTPNQAFAEEYSIHAKHHFWRADPTLSDEIVRQNYEQISKSLDAYGFPGQFWLRTESEQTGELRPGDKSKFVPEWATVQLSRDVLPCLLVRTSKGTSSSLFGDCMMSENAAKSFLRCQGLYFSRYVVSLPLFYFPSLLAGCVITLLLIPKSERRLQLEKTSLQFLYSRVDPRPRWYRQLDRWMITRAPFVWAMQFPMLIILLGTSWVSVCLLPLIVARAQHRDAADMILAATLLPVLWFICFGWWGTRVKAVSGTVHGNLAFLMAVMLIVVASGVALDLSCTSLTARPINVFAAIAAATLFWAVAVFVFVTRYVSLKVASLSLVASAPAWFPICGALFVVGFLVMNITTKDKNGFFASQYWFSSVPTFMYLCMLLSVESQDSWIVIASICCAIAYIALSIPATRALIRCRFNPKQV